MTDLWHPRAIRVPAPADKWGTYTGGPYRGVLHTTETDTYSPSSASYYGHQSWPHSTIGIKDGRANIWQHIPINRAARALKNVSGGVQTNNQSAVQTEIVWRAARAREIPPPLLEAIFSWMRWVEQAVGVKRYGAKFYGPDAGFTLASPSARQRMSAAAWNAFDGWCGHQHVPENDHWDPGAIDIAWLTGSSIPTPEEDEVTEEQEKRIVKAVVDQVLVAVRKEIIQERLDGDQGALGRLDRIEQKVSASGGAVGSTTGTLKVTGELHVEA